MKMLVLQFDFELLLNVTLNSSLSIPKADMYSEPSQASKMELFVKIVDRTIRIIEKLHLRYLAWF